MENLLFPKLHFISKFEQNIVPTTVDVTPQYDFLIIESNGERHHFKYYIPVNFDIKKYEIIYNSLKNKGVLLSSPYVSYGTLLPSKFKTIEPDFDSMSKEELISFIKQGKTYRPDINLYFNSSLLNVDYVRTPHFFGPKGKMYECQKYKTLTLFPLFRSSDNKFNYDELFENNLGIINQTIERSTYNCIYKIEMEEIQFTDELTIHIFYIHGATVKF